MVSTGEAFQDVSEEIGRPLDSGSKGHLAESNHHLFS